MSSAPSGALAGGPACSTAFLMAVITEVIGDALAQCQRCSDHGSRRRGFLWRKWFDSREPHSDTMETDLSAEHSVLAVGTQCSQINEGRGEEMVLMHHRNS